MGPSGIGASLGSSAATMSGEGGVAVNYLGEGDVTVGDSGEGAVIIGDLGEGDVMVGDWGEGDASPPTKIGMTSSHVSDSGHSSLRQWPCG